jgi:hypothetical protein
MRPVALVVSQSLKNELTLNARERVPNQVRDTCAFACGKSNDGQMGGRSDDLLVTWIGINTSTDLE